MAKRFTDTGKWDKKWFRELKPKYKCFWDYITCKCDMAGIWEVDFEAAQFYIKEDISQEEIFNILKDQIYVINDKKWLIKDFIKFQYSVERLTPSSPIHKKVIEILNKHNLYDSLRHSIVEGVHTTLSPSLFDSSDENDALKTSQTSNNQSVDYKRTDDFFDRVGGRLSHSQQEKEKEEEEEKEKGEEEGTHELQIFVLENLPHVSKMKKQLTFTESKKLVELFGIQDVKDILMRMDNKKGVEKKYNTVYQTCRQWCGNNFSSNGNISEKTHTKKTTNAPIDKATAKEIANSEKITGITTERRKNWQ